MNMILHETVIPMTRKVRFEAREKLERIRPDSLRRAGSIPGVNPADLALLSIAVKRASV